ncbi:MAG: trimethylamine methyltransferase family protein, partial [Anaerolineales bacterium]|nr:trimethylamine methyltransferase family protein [Anaerolineales bacterium]
FGTDGEVPGWQTAAEAGTILMLCALCGAETGSGLGLTESCTLLYPEEIILDSEIYHYVRIEAAGLDLSPEMLALDVIKDVGPRGHFLRHRHTRKYLRELEFSEIVDQPGEGSGYRDPVEVAREKVEWILENHHSEPLGEAERAELKRILQVAEHELA